ncbi:uncharacterized protein LOC108669905 [Hyalella azteca]|uniref:Uncharacterized protein LOC108669905 n=1 Tax=Hyalella azteca TaxID=294128 RepID=A0A8B7NGS1_HYAAZ|nr:uncharacterized protein LOC108669905 [Hyalella azteca]
MRRLLPGFTLLMVLASSQLTSAAQLPAFSGAGMPTVQSLKAKCGRLGMTVNVVFDQAFPGIIYSKGHYADKRCNYVGEDNKFGAKEFSFLIPVDDCGTAGEMASGRSTKDGFYENTIIIQLDPLITEVWDEARLLRCSWPHSLTKKVAAAPFFVAQSDKVSVEFDKRSINTLMEVQQGPSPLAAPASGYIYAGAESSMVIYIQDPGKNMDANVVNCSASNRGKSSVQLLDESGCLLRPDLMTRFDKSRDSNGVRADLMLYSYLKDFDASKAADFVIRCELELCKGGCSLPCLEAKTRKRRNVRGDASDLASPHEGAFSHESVGGLIELKETLRHGMNAEEGAFLVIKRENQEGIKSGCSLSWSVFVSLLALLLIIAALALLSCYLAVKLIKGGKFYST